LNLILGSGIVVENFDTDLGDRCSGVAESLLALESMTKLAGPIRGRDANILWQLGSVLQCNAIRQLSLRSGHHQKRQQRKRVDKVLHD
jgi:hypothetical protein